MQDGSWSASTSPARSPSPSRFGVHSSAQHRSKKERPKNHPAHQPYDTTILCERSRSPSPASLLQELRDRDHTRRKYRNGMGPPGHVQHSYPVLVTRRQGQGRRLPPTPCKPSTLQLQQTNINFPKLNASPTHTLHSAHTTPHSVHSLPPSREFLREHHQHHHLHGGGGGPREHHHHHQHQHRDLYYRERDRERDRERYRSSRSERITDAYGGGGSVVGAPHATPTPPPSLHYEFRDRERELYEREREIEREFEREYERLKEYCPDLFHLVQFRIAKHKRLKARVQIFSSKNRNHSRIIAARSAQPFACEHDTLAASSLLNRFAQRNK
ncbi:conserved hypothetical protein [Culex quinquefasciatus]|uniref:Uncharacterized protein n=1 Tax=Culex quinquefasciatus TaxID=7176 RepID=B0WDX6_CULQU|nr:conserved hypothetical protein [Culex quinquefasciatus]|eukprot:XP_001846910.1 conserved hypothetical protein [Culex quinquefasciatus]